jgi:adenylyltransferase/sulfurtransferase
MNRYGRQTSLPQIGEAGQDRLASARVLLVGCGALGTVIAEQLARGGIGFLRIADRDVVELTNLQRQTLFTEDDAARGTPKALAAAARLSGVNSTITIDPRVVDIHSGNIESLITDVDLILDGTDNVETRYLINDAAVKNGKPWVYGASVATAGRAMGIVPGSSPCLRCLFPDPARAGELPTCDTAGVLASASAIAASLQVAEALKILLNDNDAAATLITFELWPARFRAISTRAGRRAECPTCGEGRFDFLDARPNSMATTLCGRQTVQIRPIAATRIDLKQVAARLQTTAESDQFLRAALPDHGMTLTLFPDGRALVHGTSDPAAARSIYARYVGI